MAERRAIRPAHPVVALTLVCVVSGIVLGVVNDITAPLIEQAKQERTEETYSSLAERAVDFAELKCESEGVEAAYEALDANGERIAYIIVASARGFGGAVPVAVGMDMQGKIVAVVVMDNKETPGVGTKATEADYLEQYVGMTSLPKMKEVDLVSGATRTSKAVYLAVGKALVAFKEVSS